MSLQASVSSIDRLRDEICFQAGTRLQVSKVVRLSVGKSVSLFVRCGLVEENSKRLQMHIVGSRVTC